jgi:ribonuclease BN (tRNA processing enzyme)
MELTVLGKSPSWQDIGGACSAYLVRDGDFTLLLDCGSGAFAKLRTQRDYMTVDAVLITHMHADHCLDLVPFASALSYSPRRFERDAVPPPALYVPEGGRATLRRLGAAFENEGLIERVFELSEYAADAELDLGPLHVRFCEVPHYIPAFAAELTNRAGARLTFGADCGPNDALGRFAAGAELLIVEATEETPGEGFRGHMTAREAGELGRRANAARLLISHFSDELEPTRLLAEAEAGFGSAVELAREGARFTV